LYRSLFSFTILYKTKIRANKASEINMIVIASFSCMYLTNVLRRNKFSFLL